MDFIIRDVEEKDLKQVAEISVNGWKKAYKGIVDDEYLDSLDANEKYEKFKHNFKEGSFIVAANAEKVLGFCRYCDIYRDDPDDENIDCELCALYVNWDDRGSGIGRALVEYTKAYFKSNGKRHMVIWCFKENHKARGFYEKLGGKLYAEKEIERGGKKYKEVGYIYELF